MGWTYSHKDPRTSAADYIEHESGALKWSDVEEAPQVVARSRSGSTLYFAVRFPAELIASDECYARAPDGSVVMAVIFLTKSDKKDHYNFGYKDMSETMGPYETGASLRFLDLLSPIVGESQSAQWARRWRDSCRATAALGAKRRKIKPGDKVTLEAPLSFAGHDVREFVADSYYRRGKTRMAFRAVPQGFLCRLSARHLGNATIETGVTS